MYWHSTNQQTTEVEVAISFMQFFFSLRKVCLTIALFQNLMKKSETSIALIPSSSLYRPYFISPVTSLPWRRSIPFPGYTWAGSGSQRSLWKSWWNWRSLVYWNTGHGLGVAVGGVGEQGWSDRRQEGIVLPLYLGKSPQQREKHDLKYYFSPNTCYGQ